ncbi:MAG TPA: AgmX/PglI C-terminal domain-containing protein [Pseudomonadota bacterium]|nr:AgmX/PglI C-terminal domain-containing protein [Pseudomonadota bacterium]
MPGGVTVPLTFQVFKGEQLLQTVTLNQDNIKVGRLSSSHLHIDDPSIARIHAVVEVTAPNEVSIVDFGSEQGTYVNGQKVNKQLLSSGDEVTIGDIRIVVAIGEPQASPDATLQVDLNQFVGTPAAASIPAPMVAGFGAASASTGFAPVAAPSPRQSGLPRNYGIQGFVAPTDEIESRDGARAVEVSACFEDTVVDVRLLQNPAAGVVQPMTKGLIWGGALALVAALSWFMVAYFQVAKLRADRDAWEATGKPMAEFRSNQKKDHPATDIACGILLVAGAGVLLWGLFRRFDELGDRDFTIGNDPEANFQIGTPLPAGIMPLVHSTGSDFELLFTPQMSGKVQEGDRTISLHEALSSGLAKPAAAVAGAYAMPIGTDARISVQLGENTFHIVGTPRAKRMPVPVEIDWGTQSYTGGVFAITGLFLALIFSIPPDPRSLSLDAFMNDQRFAKLLTKPPEQKEEVIPEWLKKKQDEDMGGKGKRHKDEEGRMGKKDSLKKQGLYALKGPKDNQDPHLAKQLAKDAAEKAGVLGIIKSNQGSILASAFGRDSALGTDAADVLGSLVGTEVGEAYGNGGLGLVGSGRGGGGTGEGTIGLGNLGTIGKGGGGGGLSGYGRGAGGLGGRRASAPDVVPGTAEVRGSLDKEIIRRIIRRHINEVKFCYERELVRTPGLLGRVMIQFTIAGTGQVVASLVQSSTLNSMPVEQCIAQAVRRWEFPKPQGGGIVVVTYPFVLKASGGEE